MKRFLPVFLGLLGVCCGPTPQQASKVDTREKVAVQNPSSSSSHDFSPPASQEPRFGEDFTGWSQAKEELKEEAQSRQHLFVTAENHATFRSLSVDEFHGSRHVLYIVGACGGLPSHSAAIEALTRRLKVHDRFRIIDHSTDAGVKMLEDLQLPRKHWRFPSLAMLDGGILVDYMPGTHNDDVTTAFLKRNQILPAADGDFFALEYKGASRHFDTVDLDGADFRDAWLQSGSLSGASLVDADFRGADLRYTNFARANLKGARLDGARTEGALWIGATCPDGTFADEHPSRSCEGHLHRVK